MSAAAVLLPGFVGTRLPEWLAARLRDGLAGVCLFAENIVSAEQLRDLTASIRVANPLAIIAVDEEGGDVTRLHAATGSPFPGNAVLGRLDDLALTAAVGAAVAGELRAAGVNLNLAPDADINSDPRNPVIGVRSFGTDPELVAHHTAAWVAAHEAGGVAVSVKHFPGHGDTAADSHHALPVVDLPLDRLRERELLPFRAAIEAGARTVMSSHILLPRLDPDAPATFSARILDGLLRQELGFAGVVVSDALDMAGASAETGIPVAAVRALAGGCDLLCLGTRNTDDQLAAIETAIATAVARESGADGAGGASAGLTLAPDRLADAAARVRALAVGLATSGTDGVPGPGDEVPAFVLDPARLADAFDIVPGTVVPARHLLVVLETAANMAVGPDVPWGPASAGVQPLRLHEGDPLPGSTVPYVVVGKDVHRWDWTREVADRARALQPASVVIDMGWPSPDRRYADIATFGASRSVATALQDVLDGRER